VNPLYPVVAERAVYRCEYCHAPEVVFNFPFEVEHILPQARGGTDALDNLALACHACNLFKSDFKTGQDEGYHSCWSCHGGAFADEPCSAHHSAPSLDRAWIISLIYRRNLTQSAGV
jgi:HNH endonuclease